MPTKKKRVGFIPREDVMKIIDKLSIENNLSNSKIVSILVEEALALRGIFNKKSGKITESYNLLKDNKEELYDYSCDFKNDEKLSLNNNLENNKNSVIRRLLKETNQDTFNLENYEKFLAFLKFQKMMDEYNG